VVLRPLRPFVPAGLLCVAAAAIATLPRLRFAYPSSDVELALATATFLFAGLTGGMLVGLFRLARGAGRFVEPFSAPFTVLLGLAPLVAAWAASAPDPGPLAAAGVQAALFASLIVAYARGLDRRRRTRAAAAAFATLGTLAAVSIPATAGSALVGDACFVASGLLLLADVFGDVRDSLSLLSRSEAVEREKELAREFHDSLAQDLAFIATYTSSLCARAEGPALSAELAEAARRALDESRRAIAVLSGAGAFSAESSTPLGGPG
jgi:signal transduction histidine kinase